LQQNHSQYNSLNKLFYHARMQQKFTPTTPYLSLAIFGLSNHQWCR